MSERRRARPHGALRMLVVAAAIASLALAAMPRVAASQDVRLKLARVLSYQKKYDEAISRYREYLSTHPKDAQAHLELGDIFFWTKDADAARAEYALAAADPRIAPKAAAKESELLFAEGRFGEAVEQSRAALEKDPSDVETRLRLARALSYEKRYDESLEEYGRILEADSQNLAALSERADVLSWVPRYDEAEAAYERRLEVAYDPQVARQRARMLGWARRYGRSLAAYRDAAESSGSPGIELEREGKEAFWNGWALTAIDRYRELLVLEPGNVEARFDLGQTEGYQRMWRQAARDFEAIVQEAPYHFRAADGLEKTRILWKDPSVTPAFRWFRARSDDRSTHIDWFRSGVDAIVPLHQAVSVHGGYAFDYFHYSDVGGIPRHQGSIGLDLSATPRVWGSATYLPTVYSSDHRTSHLFDGSVSARPVDPVILTAFALRDDLINQKQVFVDELRTTQAGARAQFDVHRRWKIFADYRYDWVNDGNRRNGAGLENLVVLSYEPKRLTFDARFDYQDWRQSVPAYWSPQNFWTITCTVHWRHYLNPNGLYFGARNTYYGLKYRLSVDRGKNVFNGGTLELYRDFTPRISAGAEAFGNWGSVYNDTGAQVSLTGRF